MKTTQVFMLTILLLSSFIGCGGSSEETKHSGNETPTKDNYPGSQYTTYDKDYVGVGSSTSDNKDTEDNTIPKKLMEFQKEYQIDFGSKIIAQEYGTKVKLIVQHGSRKMTAVLIDGSAEIK